MRFAATTLLHPNIPTSLSDWLRPAAYVRPRALQVASMDSVQGLQAALCALADRKTFASGIRLAVSGSNVPQPSRQLFQEHFKTVFIDGSGWVNIAGHVSQSQLAEV